MEQRARKAVKEAKEKKKADREKQAKPGWDSFHHRAKAQPEQAREHKQFVVGEQYPALRQALLARGWVEAPRGSRDFDLCWVASPRLVDRAQLKPGQVVNYFSATDPQRRLTSKAGLLRCLRDSHWFGVPCDEFVPASFDLSDAAERDDFVAAFKRQQAHSVLQRFVEDCAAAPPPRRQGYGQRRPLPATFPAAAVRSAMQVVARGLPGEEEHAVTDGEWASLGRCSLQHPGELQPLDLEPEGGLVAPPGGACDGALLVAAKRLLSQAPALTAGHASAANAWVAKASSSSRGRHVKLLTSGDEAAQLGDDDGHWICQKYIERPLLIGGHKVDLRLWVLVTGWNPLTSFVFSEPYVRFAPEPFDPSLRDPSERVHVTTSGVGNLHPSDEQSPCFPDAGADHDFPPNELRTCGLTWFREDLERWLHARECPRQNHCFGDQCQCPSRAGRCARKCQSPFQDRVWPRMKQLVQTTLRSDHGYEGKQPHVELYGFDFLLAEDLSVWLLEVNQSPSFEYTTEVTAALCEKCLRELPLALFDAKHLQVGERLGGWELLTRDPRLSNKEPSVDLLVQGLGVEPQVLPLRSEPEACAAPPGSILCDGRGRPPRSPTRRSRRA